MERKILIIEDEENYRNSLGEILRREGHSIETCGTAEEGMTLLAALNPDIILLDYVLPGMDGLQALKAIKGKSPNSMIIIMTAFGTIEKAVEAMKEGAFDYITKSVDQEEIKARIHKAIQVLSMKEELGYFRSKEQAAFTLESILGSCRDMEGIFERIRRIASQPDTTVLITGETGTGKNMVARAVHNLSPRKDRPYIEIDCLSIPGSLLESELFGHEAGAFTGARGMKKGLFEIAQGGSIFLDEIGDMSTEIQGKLLKVIDEKVIRRVGGLRSIRLDVRIIASTNRDLVQMIDNNSFRRDLYHRLKVCEISLPPLRKRGKDVLLLADHFIRFFNKKFNKRARGMSNEARESLLAYRFPGNVRELKNTMELAVSLSDSDILEPKHFPFFHEGAIKVAQDTVPRATADESLNLQCMERALVDKAMDMAEGNRTRAAELLGISRFTLQRKLEKHHSKSHSSTVRKRSTLKNKIPRG